MWIVSPSATSSCIFVVFVGIWSFCNSIIPRSGCRRLAKSIHSEVENHAGTVILQVAQIIKLWTAEFYHFAISAVCEERLLAVDSHFAISYFWRYMVLPG